MISYRLLDQLFRDHGSNHILIAWLRLGGVSLFLQHFHTEKLLAIFYHLTDIGNLKWAIA